MAQRDRRRSAYGAPLPELTDASREVLKDRPTNVAQRRRLNALLDEVAQTLLRRQVHATVTLSFQIVDGVMQAEIDVAVSRHYRYQREE